MSIKLNRLKATTIDKTDVDITPVYSDLHLDLKFDYTIRDQLYSKAERKDLMLDYNAESIRNSLSNIFSTLPGQKLLNPRFGLDLRTFLFYPISTSYARCIAENILFGIQYWEPRITVSNVNVYPDEDNLQYVIDITYSIPLFGDQSDKKIFKFHTTLTKN